MTRYAVLAGSNYIGTRSELRGCINDLTNIRNLIEPSGIKILADLRNEEMSASNWKNALSEAVKVLKPGDVMFHSHSNHGSRVRIGDELCECYCPDDVDGTIDKLITDKWMAELIGCVPTGAKWIEFADNCNSGDSIRCLWVKEEKPKFITFPWLRNDDQLPLNPMVVNMATNGILLAACRSDETATDAYLNGQSQGAFTASFIKALKALPHGNYQQLMIKTTQLLGLGGFNQHPEINCNNDADLGIFSNDVLGVDYKSFR